MSEGNHKHLKGELRRFEYRMTGEVFLQREKTYVEIYVRMPSGETVVFVGAKQLTPDERFELAVSLAHLMGLPVDVWYSEGEDGCLHIHEIQVDSPHYSGTGNDRWFWWMSEERSYE